MVEEQRQFFNLVHVVFERTLSKNRVNLVAHNYHLKRKFYKAALVVGTYFCFQNCLEQKCLMAYFIKQWGEYPRYSSPIDETILFRFDSCYKS